MNNSNDPSRTELPSSAQLLKSTLIALVVASVILVTVVLPAEYAIDPTGIGSALGLTRMGEIKNQLADEEAVEIAASAEVPAIAAPTPVDEQSEWRDQTEVTIAPDEAIELKLVMGKGDRAEYEWSTDGGLLNFNTHGDGGGQSVEYDKGRETASKQGELVAAFEGHHGWFWRNRSGQPVSLTLRTRGSYSQVKRTR